MHLTCDLSPIRRLLISLCNEMLSYAEPICIAQYVYYFNACFIKEKCTSGVIRGYNSIEFYIHLYFKYGTFYISIHSFTLHTRYVTSITFPCSKCFRMSCMYDVRAWIRVIGQSKIYKIMLYTK